MDSIIFMTLFVILVVYYDKKHIFSGLSFRNIDYLTNALLDKEPLFIKFKIKDYIFFQLYSCPILINKADFILWSLLDKPQPIKNCYTDVNSELSSLSNSIYNNIECKSFRLYIMDDHLFIHLNRYSTV